MFLKFNHHALSRDSKTILITPKTYLTFKGIVHLKIKISWTFNYPQAIQDVHENMKNMHTTFIRTDLEKCSITSFANQWILCSEWVPSEWESKQRIKISKKSTSNQHDSSP